MKVQLKMYGKVLFVGVSTKGTDVESPEFEKFINELNDFFNTQFLEAKILIGPEIHFS